MVQGPRRRAVLRQVRSSEAARSGAPLTEAYTAQFVTQVIGQATEAQPGERGCPTARPGERRYDAPALHAYGPRYIGCA